MEIKTHMAAFPQKTFFFERKDGSVFATEEREADSLIKTNKFNYIGCSNGVAFASKMTAIQNDWTLQKITDEERRQRILQAEKEEIEIARGHLETPRDFTKTDANGNPRVIKL